MDIKNTNMEVMEKPQKKKSNVGLYVLISFLFLFMVGVFAVGGWFVWSFSASVSDVENSVANLSESVENLADSEEAMEKDASNLKVVEKEKDEVLKTSSTKKDVFAVDEFDFQFEFPREWFATWAGNDFNDGKLDVYDTEKNEIKFFDPEYLKTAGDSDVSPWAVRVEVIEGQDIEDYKEKYLVTDIGNGDGSFESLGEETIGSYLVSLYYSGFIADNYSYYFQHNNDVIYIQTADKEYRDEIELIIKSFLDKSEKNTTFESSSDVPFSFEYPASWARFEEGQKLDGEYMLFGNGTSLDYDMYLFYDFDARNSLRFVQNRLEAADGPASNMQLSYYSNNTLNNLPEVLQDAKSIGNVDGYDFDVQQYFLPGLYDSDYYAFEVDGGLALISGVADNPRLPGVLKTVELE